MEKFEDAKGEVWTITIDINKIKRVRERLGIDLIKAAEGQELLDLADDIEALINLIYVLCADQAEERGMTDEDFGACLVGDVFDKSYIAMMTELVNFFPSRKGRLLKAAWTKTDKMTDQAINKGVEMIESQEMDKYLMKMETEVKKKI